MRQETGDSLNAFSFVCVCLLLQNSVAGQQCAVYFSTRQLHQQGGCFFVQPLGGKTRLLLNKNVPFLPQTIKETLAEKKSKRSVSSFISKNKHLWVDWAPQEGEGTLLAAGDERLALTDQRVGPYTPQIYTCMHAAAALICCWCCSIDLLLLLQH